MKLKKLNLKNYLKNYFKKDEIIIDLKSTDVLLNKDIRLKYCHTDIHGLVIKPDKGDINYIKYEETLYFDKMLLLDQDGKEHFIGEEPLLISIPVDLKLDKDNILIVNNEKLNKDLKMIYKFYLNHYYKVKDIKDLEPDTYAWHFYEQNKDIFEYDKK